MDTLISTADLRRSLSDTLGRVQYAGDRVVIGRHGNPVAALVSLDDLRALEAMEDAADIELADKAHLEAEREGAVTWEDVRESLA